MFENIISAVQKKQPHIHNITNFVSATDQANITLAVGGSPIMASSPKEAAQVCSVCDGLVLNTGILTDNALEAMLYAVRKQTIEIFLLYWILSERAFQNFVQTQLLRLSKPCI